MSLTLFSFCAYCRDFGHNIQVCSSSHLCAFGTLCLDQKENLSNSIFMFHYWLSCYVNADATHLRNMKFYCIRYCQGRLNDSVDVLSRKIANHFFQIRDQDEEREEDDFIPFMLPTSLHRSRFMVFEPLGMTMHDMFLESEEEDTTTTKKELNIETVEKNAEEPTFDCPICLENKELDVKRMTNCKHALCAPCLDNMVVGNRMFVCHMCRESVHTVYTIKII